MPQKGQITKHDTTYWAVQDPTGKLYPVSYGIQYTREELIKRVVKNSQFTWRQLYGFGWRAVKVSVTCKIEEDTPSPGK